MFRYLLVFLVPTLASAQSPCPATRYVASTNTTEAWTAPLDRTVSLRARDITLRDALDRVAAAARLRFSYSSETLTLDQRVCATFDQAAVGAVLAELLRGTGVSAISAGGEQVVLVAARNGALPEIIPLEKIVVTGSTNGLPRRALTVGLEVIQGSALEHQHAATMADILRAHVPGMWVWQQAPNSLLTQYASVRGASSFGLTYPKIYLDGIEIANPLLLSRIAPSSIDRIEAIRGPQGAALYGADAISGVINLVTRNQGFDQDTRGIDVGSNLGVIASGYASETVMRQQHTIDYQMGTNVSSAAITVSGGESDAFFPGASARELSALARYRGVRANLNINGTARLFAQEAGNGVSPLLLDALPDSLAQRPALLSNTDPQQVVQYTIGGNIAYSSNDRWTHTFVAGVDGYELDNVVNLSAPLPTPLDSALQAARGGALRMTLRASSLAHLVSTPEGEATFTAAIEHSQLRKESQERAAFPTLVTWRSNTGLIGQLNGSLRERVHLSAGLRLERNQAFVDEQFAALPMLGANYVQDIGSATMKLRAAYGRGIRAPQSGVRDLHHDGPRPPGTELEAESQAGYEAGVDVWLDESLSLQLTRFDQTASGLIQQVAVATQPQPGDRRGLRFMQQNVGEISNRGWELQATARVQSFSLIANYSTVDSRVQHVARGYTGDLLAGDRMLNVPERTVSVTASWQPTHWSASITAVRAFDWIGYDRSSLAAAFVDTDRPTSGFIGSQLRAYWRAYDGVTWLRASLARDVARRFSIVLLGDNLLDEQQGEPDDITVLPGRTMSLGVRANF
jgi:iron complex outermembrane receptor protein